MAGTVPRLLKKRSLSFPLIPIIMMVHCNG